MKSTLLLRLEPEIKEKLQEISKLERRSMSSIILILIDKKIAEVANGETGN